MLVKCSNIKSMIDSIFFKVLNLAYWSRQPGRDFLGGLGV